MFRPRLHLGSHGCITEGAKWIRSPSEGVELRHTLTQEWIVIAVFHHGRRIVLLSRVTLIVLEGVHDGHFELNLASRGAILRLVVFRGRLQAAQDCLGARFRFELKQGVVEHGKFLLLFLLLPLLLLPFIVLLCKLDLQIDSVVRQQHPLVLFYYVHVVALRRVLRQNALYQILKLLRVWPVSRKSQLAVNNPVFHLLRRVSIKWKLVKEHAKEHAAERPNVQSSSRFGISSLQNLGCHKLEGTRIRFVIDGGGGAASDTEIDNFYSCSRFRLEKHVLEL